MTLRISEMGEDGVWTEVRMCCEFMLSDNMNKYTQEPICIYMLFI